MVNQVNLPQIRMIIDYYHLRLENESLSIFEKAHDKINHLQTSDVGKASFGPATLIDLNTSTNTATFRVRGSATIPPAKKR